MALGSVNVPGAFGLERRQDQAALAARMASVEKTLGGLEKIPGTAPPVPQVAAHVGQIYINVITGEQWKCVASGESGTVWEKQETDGDKSGFTEELTARVESLEKTISGMEKIPGSVPPTSQVTAQVGQMYINTATGEQWVCVKADADGTEWEKRETQKLQVGVFSAGTTPPEDKHLLWIDTTAGTGGLKYWNGSAWAAVPVGYT